MSDIRVTVNGRTRSCDGLGPHTRLLDWLRGEGLTGAKEGCAEGECGACAVLVARPSGARSRWTPVNACLVPALALDGQEVVYIAQAQSNRSMRMFTEVGRRADTHDTGVGKAMLATLPDERVRAIVGAAGMATPTPKSIGTLEELFADLDRIRERGYAIDDEETELGVRCYAMAVPRSEEGTTSLSARAASAHSCSAGSACTAAE